MKKPLLKSTRLLQSLIVAAILILLVFTLSFGPYVLGIIAPNFIYSEGDRVGQVTKLSKKGLIWKTWEASMGLTQSGSYVEHWNFSIDNGDPQRDILFKKVTESYNSGDIVKVHYIQHLGIIPWRGKTSYHIQNIETVQANPLKKIQDSSEETKRYNEEIKKYNEKLLQN